MKTQKTSKFVKVYDEWTNLIGYHELESGKEVCVTATAILILAKIANWENQNLPCYMTNEQLGHCYGCSTKTAATAISILNKMGLIEIEKEGSKKRRRILKLTKYAYECIQ